MIKLTVFLAVLIMFLDGSGSETPDIVIAVTPTRETIVASGLTGNNTFFELNEYETTDNIVLSSFIKLDLNKNSKVKGRITGIENGKYVFSVEENIFDLSTVGNK